MERDENAQLVFVYGTLKQGHPNHHYFEDVNIGRATFIGTATTVDPWPLVVTTRFSLPYLVDHKGLGYPIRGELYEIDDRMMEFCDDFEDHPQIYERTKTQVKLDQLSMNVKESILSEKYLPGTVIDCWCYMLRKISPKILNLPFYEEYQGTEVDIMYDPAREQECDYFTYTLIDLGIMDETELNR